MKIRTDFITNSSSSSFILNYLADNTALDNEESVMMLYSIIKEIVNNLRIMEEAIKLNDKILYNHLQKFFKQSNIVFKIDANEEFDNYYDMRNGLEHNKTLKIYINNAANKISSKLNIKEDLSDDLLQSYLDYNDIKWILELENDTKLKNCKQLYNFRKNINNISGYEIDGILCRFGYCEDISEYVPDDIIKKTQVYEFVEEEYEGIDISTADKIILARNRHKITLSDIILELLRTDDNIDKLIEKLISEHFGYIILHGDNNEIPQIIKVILVNKLKHACEFY